MQAGQAHGERREPPVDGHAAGKSADHEGHHPEIGVGIDQEGKADPVKGHHEIAKAEEPAEEQRRPARGGAFQHGKEQGHGGEEQRPCAKRRQGQRGQRASQDGDAAAPPASEFTACLSQPNHGSRTIGVPADLWYKSRDSRGVAA